MKAIDVMQLGFGHIALGLALMALFGPLWWLATGDVVLSAWAAWGMQCAWWASRERRDYEHRLGFDPHSEWYRGWDFWNWTRDDLWCPVFVNAVVPVLLWRLA